MMIYVAPQPENGIEMEKNYWQYHADARQSNKLKQNHVSHRLEDHPCLQQLKIFAPFPNFKMADLCRVVYCGKFF
jgi:hypothetical protein